MIRIYKDGELRDEELLKRNAPKVDVSGVVSGILADVRENGDKAVLKYTEKFDGARLDTMLVSEEEIEEEGRYTEMAAELDEERVAVLNRRLCRLAESGREAVFIWFRPDGRKAGGSYGCSRAAIRKFDELEQTLCLDNGERIPLALLYDVRED